MSAPEVQPRSHARFLSPGRRPSESPIQKMTWALRGVWVVARRRGFKYFVDVATGFVWPFLTFHVFWGASGPRASWLLRPIRRIVARSAPPSAIAGPDAADAEAVRDAMERQHAAGVTGGRYLHARTSGLLFRYFRDLDRTNYNRRFGRELLTERGARQRLAAVARDLSASTPYGGWYSGIDFGGGLAVGKFLGTDAGTGRWAYLNQRVVAPYVRGKRVLDLGANDGSMGIMMLRSGAREVVGIELAPAYVQAARLVKEIFEWRDRRVYPFVIDQGSMLRVLSEDFGRFDVITAFCSLYCVEEEWMARVVRKCAELAPVLILQANMPKRGGKAHHVRASADFLHRLLLDHGFPHVEVVAPAGYARPLLIGRVAAGGRQ